MGEAVRHGRAPDGFPQKSSTCATATLPNSLADAVTIPLQMPANLTQIACTASDTGGTTNYREAPANQPRPNLKIDNGRALVFPPLPATMLVWPRDGGS